MIDLKKWNEFDAYSLFSFICQQIHDDLEKEDFNGSGLGPDDEDLAKHLREKQPAITGNNKQQPNRKDQRVDTRIDTDMESGSGDKNIDDDNEDDDDDEEDDIDDTEHNVLTTNTDNLNNKPTDSKTTENDNEDIDESEDGDDVDDDLTTEIDEKHDIDPTTTDDEDLERQCMVYFLFNSLVIKFYFYATFLIFFRFNILNEIFFVLIKSSPWGIDVEYRKWKETKSF